MRLSWTALIILLSGCSAAFEVGEALNRATTNISSDPARYLWSKDSGSPEPVQPNAASSVPASNPPQTMNQ